MSPWRGCNSLNASLTCYRTREAACVRSSDNTTAPWYYCTDAGLERPVAVEECPPGSCMQNCAVSEWSAWSECHSNCSLNLFRNRTREVLSPPQNGGLHCPSLHESMVCPCVEHISFESQPRRYTWKTGRWSACRAINATSQCGGGVRSRTVECVDVDRLLVAPENCLQEMAYSLLHPPVTGQFCEVPCPCIQSDWGPESPCTPLCDTPVPSAVKTRRRSVVQSPTLGGQQCGPAEKTIPCTIAGNPCPVYVWETSDWSPCNFQTGATCGDGHMIRFVNCLEVWNETAVVVNDAMCHRLGNSSRPSSFRTCQVGCPQPCLVGAWSTWTHCPARSCNQTFSTRERPILVPPSGREVCPHTVELRPCPILDPPCARWLAQPFVRCFRGDFGCGPGTQTRNVACVDSADEVVDSALCSNIPEPERSQSCHIPCPNDCVLSEWSAWSLCTERCGGRTGNQTRERFFLAYGTDCTFTEEDLVETRSCSDPTECIFTRFYIAHQPWSMCMEEEGQSPRPLGDGSSITCGGRVGIRNRTSVCMEGDHVISTSECPLTFQPILSEECELPCLKDCMYSEWTPFSECACESEMRTRSRRLTQFFNLDSSECDVNENGMQIEYEVCTPICSERGVVWHSSVWSSCNLFDRVQETEPATCGLGYQNRTVSCIEVGTNLVVPDLECATTLDEPRPAIGRSCYTTCTSSCLVTDWSEFPVCSYGDTISRHRDIVPYTGCNDWRECCPQLFSISTTETLTCPTFSSFIYASASPYSECILDSPHDTCGNGMEYRSVACFASDYATIVDNIFCDMSGAPVPDAVAPCNIRCQKNCVQSDWTSWSQCNTTCGIGHRSRTRSTMTPSRPGGRPCGQNEEVEVCLNKPCPFAQVIPGPFGGCVPNNLTSECGAGTRRRSLLCFVDLQQQDFSVCEDLGATPSSFSLEESCTAPCPGECVLGEWEEWMPCSTNCPVGSCRRERTREILREGTERCLDMVQEFQTCSQPENSYHWVADPWEEQACIISSLIANSPTPGHYCGEGLRTRAVTCVNSTDTVPGEFCLEAGEEEPSSIKNCTLPCPVDCQVGVFSQWSECEDCSSLAEQRRNRSILVPPLFGGEECPGLVQSRSCLPKNCEAFELVRHTPLTLVDFTEQTQCGLTLVQKPVSCHRNAVFLQPSECLDGAPPPESYDQQLCPLEPNCTYTPWSNWSECTVLCHTPQDGFSYRTRFLTSSLPLFVAGCEAEQTQQRACMTEPRDLDSFYENGTEPVTTEPDPDSSVDDCIDFVWQASEWTSLGRTVYCQSNTGIRVENMACPDSTMPRTQNETCDGLECPLDAECSDREGECQMECRVLFEEVEGVCLPLRGCRSDSHCLYSFTECSLRATCVCRQGYTETVR